MKYIRTNDGYIVDTSNMHPETLKWFLEKHTLNQADTIEELSDELVVKYKNEEKPRCINMSELLKTCKDIGVTFKYHMKWLITTYKDQLEICKLAIWADKGLIYVAEPNEEGALCLL